LTADELLHRLSQLITPAEVAFARSFPRNTVVQKYYLPTIYGAISLQKHDPAGAIEALRPAERYDFVLPEVWPNEPPVYPSYVRGLSYLQLHDGRLAAAEFQKLLDHPGLVGRTVTGALARLQLARAQQMAGDTAAALGSYEEFLTLWQDADPELPIYQAARAEYARLKKGAIRVPPDLVSPSPSWRRPLAPRRCRTWPPASNDRQMTDK